MKQIRFNLNTNRYLVIISLIFAGEIIFSLPFHVPRFFRPTMLEVFGLSNTDLGDIFAVYGITAMLAYFPGGTIADHISARKLMAYSLLATALGGVYMSTIPGILGMSILFAYWGVTSVLLFWAAMLRATREWGGKFSQGKAFGLLDGGRGLAAAFVGSLGVLLLANLLPENTDNITAAHRRHALQAVIYYYTAVTFMAALLVWFFIPSEDPKTQGLPEKVFEGIKHVFNKQAIWWQALVVVCAYCGFKGLDNYALYAVDVMGMNEVDAASFTATASYLRPLAAITAGLLADKLLASRVLKGAFVLLFGSYIWLSVLSPEPMATYIIYANLIVTFAAVYALRGIYFALFEEVQLRRHLTGTAIGLVSVIGYTPDIFFTPVAGRLLDASPGLAGHQHFFVFLTLFASLGMLAAYMLSRCCRKTV